VSIELKLKEQSVNYLYFNDIHGGRLTFKKDADHQLSATITHEEFEDFCKTNNMIIYHNTLKSYEDGQVYGEFALQEK
jgi:hypothetical protein